jgi:hypothetical protein
MLPGWLLLLIQLAPSIIKLVMAIWAQLKQLPRAARKAKMARLRFIAQHHLRTGNVQDLAKALHEFSVDLAEQSKLHRPQ